MDIPVLSIIIGSVVTIFAAVFGPLITDRIKKILAAKQQAIETAPKPEASPITKRKYEPSYHLIQPGDSTWYDPSLTSLFIVYAEEDKSVEAKLHKKLQRRGFHIKTVGDVWPLHKEEEELLKFMESSDHVLFIASK